jgi:site-specific DNA-methyltransferase (adenine-specific)
MKVKAFTGLDFMKINNLIDKIYHADCIDIMKKIPNQSIDLIITDPPYVLNTNSGGLVNYFQLNKFCSDKYKNITNGYDIDLIFDEFFRILKKINIFVFCSMQQIKNILIKCEKYLTNILIWHKHNAIPFCNGTWGNDIEYIIHIRERGATFQGSSHLKKKVKKYPLQKNNIHPTVKPIDLICQFIKIGSNEGDFIFDGFAGAGTTALACIELNRHFICVEKNLDYYNIAKKRIENEKSQLRLFI